MNTVALPNILRIAETFDSLSKKRNGAAAVSPPVPSNDKTTSKLFDKHAKVQAISEKKEDTRYRNAESKSQSTKALFENANQRAVAAQKIYTDRELSLLERIAHAIEHIDINPVVNVDACCDAGGSGLPSLPGADISKDGKNKKTKKTAAKKKPGGGWKGKAAIAALLLGGAAAIGTAKAADNTDEEPTDSDESEPEESSPVKDAVGAAAGAVGTGAMVAQFAPDAIGLAGKAAGKLGAEEAAKAAGKIALKKIPGIGLIAGGGLAVSRILEGDYKGAALELASGAASLLPGIGTAASFAIDAGIVARDTLAPPEGGSISPIDMNTPSPDAGSIQSEIAKDKIEKDQGKNTAEEQTSLLEKIAAALLGQNKMLKDGDISKGVVAGGVIIGAKGISGTSGTNSGGNSQNETQSSSSSGTIIPNDSGAGNTTEAPGTSSQTTGVSGNQSASIQPDSSAGNAGQSEPGAQSSSTIAPAQGGSLADTIAKHESQGDYNIYNQGKGHKYKQGKTDFSKMTVDEVIERQNLDMKDKNKLFAVGKYQVIPDTMKAAKKSLNLRGDEKMTPELQDRIFSEHLTTKARPQIENYVKTGKGIDSAAYSSAQEWASIGVAGKGEKSYYAGDGINKAATKSTEVKASLQQSRNRYTEALAAGKTEKEAYHYAMVGDKSGVDTVAMDKGLKAAPKMASIGSGQNTMSDVPTLQGMTESSAAKAGGIEPYNPKVFTSEGLKMKNAKENLGGGKTEEGSFALAHGIQNNVEGFNRFTAFNDEYHQSAGYKARRGNPNAHSTHQDGTAFDFTIKDQKKSDESAEQVRSMLKEAGVEGKVINEYKTKTSAGTGGHIHVNFKDAKEAEKYKQFQLAKMQQKQEQQSKQVADKQDQQIKSEQKAMDSQMAAEPKFASANSDPNTMSDVPTLQGKTEASAVASMQAAPNSAADQVPIIDSTGTKFGFGGEGEKLKEKKGFVMHHTGGRGSAKDVKGILNDRNLATQFVIDREGAVHRIIPEGEKGAHVHGSKEKQTGLNKELGLNNSNTEGVEIIAKDDADVTPAQTEAAAKLASQLGYSENQVYGHGELNSHKQETEGNAAAKRAREYIAAQKAKKTAQQEPQIDTAALDAQMQGGAKFASANSDPNTMSDVPTLQGKTEASAVAAQQPTIAKDTASQPMSKGVPTGKARIGWIKESVTNEFMKRGYTPEQAKAGGDTAAAQYVQEVGWQGRSTTKTADGKDTNNFFNIKGEKWGDAAGSKPTLDKATGKTDVYAGYSSPEKAVSGYVDFLQQNKRYSKAGVFETTSVADRGKALKKAGYAEDPNYAAKLEQIAGGKGMQSAVSEYETWKQSNGVTTQTDDGSIQPAQSINQQTAQMTSSPQSITPAEPHTSPIGPVSSSPKFEQISSGSAGASCSSSGGSSGETSSGQNPTHIEGTAYSPYELNSGQSLMSNNLENKTLETSTAISKASTPNIMLPPMAASGGGSQRQGNPGVSGASAPMITRNNDSSVRRIADMFMAYSWA